MDIGIVGLPNVGKSTLFNCLMEKNQALVSSIAGTTRDSNLGLVEWANSAFELVDTAGLREGLIHGGIRGGRDQDARALPEQFGDDVAQRRGLPRARRTPNEGEAAVATKLDGAHLAFVQTGVRQQHLPRVDYWLPFAERRECMPERFLNGIEQRFEG